MSIAKKTAYIVFSNENRDKIRREKPELSPSKISKKIANKWRSLSENEKERYRNLANIHNGDIQYNSGISINNIQKKKSPMIFSDISDYLDDDNKCLVCYCKIANVIFLPCKHRVSCKDCCEKLQKTDNKNKCIKCRQDIEKFLL
jgi:hypothetical protein